MVLALMPAKARALLFAHPACPSILSSHIGRSGINSSRVWALGNCCPGHKTWFQPRPLIHLRKGFCSAYLAISFAA